MELGQGEVFRVLHEQLVELHEADTALLPRALVGVQSDAHQVWSLKQFASVCFFTTAIRGGRHGRVKEGSSPSIFGTAQRSAGYFYRFGRKSRRNFAVVTFAVAPFAVKPKMPL